jgi:hypothetical protein
MQQRYLPTAQAGEYCGGLKAQTMRALRLEGRGPRYVRLARNRVVYDVADLDAWLADRKFGSTAEEESTRRAATSAA